MGRGLAGSKISAGVDECFTAAGELDGMSSASLLHTCQARAGWRNTSPLRHTSCIARLIRSHAHEAVVATPLLPDHTTVEITDSASRLLFQYRYDTLVEIEVEVERQSMVSVGDNLVTFSGTSRPHSQLMAATRTASATDAQNVAAPDATAHAGGQRTIELGE